MGMACIHHIYVVLLEKNTHHELALEREVQIFGLRAANFETTVAHSIFCPSNQAHLKTWLKTGCREMKWTKCYSGRPSDRKSENTAAISLQRTGNHHRIPDQASRVV